VFKMKSSIRLTSLIFCVCACVVGTGQVKKYTTANAHAHNDYEHPIPFYTAFQAGFGSIEADVFPLNGVLVVAHSKSDIKPQRTLKALYLDPLLKELSTDKSQRVALLIDIKEDYKASLSLLVQELETLRQYLSTPEKSNALTIRISGTRPPAGEYINYPSFIFFDDDLKLKHSTEQWRRVDLVSLPFYKITTWKGEDDISRKDRKAIRHIIDSVHSAGKPIRFWAAPDTEASWKLQMKLHADLIGTDKIDELARYLQKQKR
jgi:alkaline phosphatase